MGRGVALWECRRVALCRPRRSWLAGLLGQLAAVTGELLLLLTEPFKRMLQDSQGVAEGLEHLCTARGVSSERAVGSLWILILMLYVDMFCCDVEETCGYLCTPGFTQCLSFPQAPDLSSSPSVPPHLLLLYSFSCVCMTYRQKY